MKIPFYDVEVEISDWSHKLKIATIIFATIVVFAVFENKKRISVRSDKHSIYTELRCILYRNPFLYLACNSIFSNSTSLISQIASLKTLT